MNELKGILVVGESEGRGISSITKELLGGSRRLLEVAGGGVSLVLVGKKASSAAEEAVAFGADNVYLVDNQSSQDFPYDFHVNLVDRFCRECEISLCLIGHSDLGRELAPRVAARLNAGLCMDCIEIRPNVEERQFIQVRPVFGGKAVAEVASKHGVIQINTVRSKSMGAFVYRSERKGNITDMSDRVQDRLLRTRLIDRKTEEESGVKIETAHTIVAGGGGIGGKEGFELIRELSVLLKAAVGASRVPVDEGWLPHSAEIGQTGKIVSPDVYMAIAISGATQHVTGILGSKRIVAINKDPDANIFKVADVGVVADYKELLPHVIEKLKKIVR